MPVVHVFALTGGIASGKSTVARRFRERGLPVIDADLLARRAVEPGGPILPAIARVFGQAVVGPDGQLDRKALGRLVFADPQARATLNRIVHPEVQRLAEREFTELSRAGVPLACYEVPLLFETSQQDRYRPVVVVQTSEASQLARLQARDGLSPREALQRIQTQLPLRQKAALADHVIDNSGAPADTERQADTLLKRLCAELGLRPARYFPPD